MKIFPIYILTFLSAVTFSQTSNEPNWTYSDFIENNIKKVSSYSIPLKRNGKIKRRDSTLLLTKQVDMDSNTVFGVNSSLVVVTHGDSYLTWNRFKDFYNQKGLILKETSSSLETTLKKEFGFISYDVNEGEIIYEYDNQNNLLRKEFRTINNHYSIHKSTKDTFHLKSIYRPQIYEYVYNLDNNKLKQFITVDSIRYLNIEWKYDQEKRLVEWVSYTGEEEIHTKRYYFYDNQNRLKKQVDSTGWYIYKKPSWNSTKTYQYSPNATAETITYNTETGFGHFYKKEITVYDSNNNLISECKFTEGTREHSDHSYKWEKGKLIEKTETNLDGQIVVQKFIYNNRNLLAEKSEYQNGKRIELIRYYYK
ncbi:hypothetical protein [Mangrovimonas sp. TPBH4]|uniref:hypothetical protein n=1 Tax=Mangrovimonas sp. TPBH4 TaxID=1645914 RepID=UPI0006B61D33|nr:hypothetical protein [Mangrovimonas sp. TPBH4]